MHFISSMIKYIQFPKRGVLKNRDGELCVKYSFLFFRNFSSCFNVQLLNLFRNCEHSVDFPVYVFLINHILIKLTTKLHLDPTNLTDHNK
jgi:hypothetical protein